MQAAGNLNVDRRGQSFIPGMFDEHLANSALRPDRTGFRIIDDFNIIAMCIEGYSLGIILDLKVDNFYNLGF